MGKQMLVYVIGLSMLIGWAIMNLHQTELSVDDLYWYRYGRSMAHGLAVSGANIGVSLCLNDTTAESNLIDQAYNGGNFNVYFVQAGDSTIITSVGRYKVSYYDYAAGAMRNMVYDTIEVKLRRIYFSEYGYFTDDENFNYLTPASNSVPAPGTSTKVYKISGDSLFGPVHTNGQWNFSGSPYFAGKVTGGTPPVIGGSSHPIFAGGKEWGVSVDRPEPRLDDIKAAAVSGGKYYTSASTGNQDIGITFQNDGKVKVKIPWNSGSSLNTTYSSIANMAPNGVIGVEGIDVHVSGTYTGRATVLARSGSANLKGNIWIQGDLVAKKDPSTDPTSTDMMGLVAERMNYITTTGISRNASSVTEVQAAIYSQNGILAVENYNTVPVSGRLDLYGSVVSKGAMVIGTFSGSTLLSGMVRSLRYDTRFQSMCPPKFPFADKSKLVSWWER